MIVEITCREGEAELTYESSKSYKNGVTPSLDEAIAILADNMDVEVADMNNQVTNQPIKFIKYEVIKKPRQKKIIIGLREGGDCDKFLSGTHPKWQEYWSYFTGNGGTRGAPGREGGRIIIKDSVEVLIPNDAIDDSGDALDDFVEETYGQRAQRTGKD